MEKTRTKTYAVALPDSGTSQALDRLASLMARQATPKRRWVPRGEAVAVAIAEAVARRMEPKA